MTDLRVKIEQSVGCYPQIWIIRGRGAGMQQIAVSQEEATDLVTKLHQAALKCARITANDDQCEEACGRAWENGYATAERDMTIGA